MEGPDVLAVEVDLVVDGLDQGLPIGRLSARLVPDIEMCFLKRAIDVDETQIETLFLG